MRSIRQLVWHLAASPVMHMLGYIRGVATVRIYPYSAFVLFCAYVVLTVLVLLCDLLDT